MKNLLADILDEKSCAVANTFKYAEHLIHPNKSINGNYLPIGSSREAAVDFILSLNAVLEDAQKITPSFPKQKIIKEKICFDNTFLEGCDFTWIEYRPFTATGKIAKYPIVLHFSVHLGNDIPSAYGAPDSIFGTMSFLDSGSIGKYDIVFWEKRKIFKINGAIKNDKLRIVRIKTTRMTTKTLMEDVKLYDYKTF